MLRKILLLPALAAVALIGACASLGGIAAGVDAVAEMVSVPVTKGLIVGNNGYQGMLAAQRLYARSGQMTPAQAERLRVLNAEALSLLEGTAQGLSAARRVERLFDIIAESDSITRRQN